MDWISKQYHHLLLALSLVAALLGALFLVLRSNELIASFNRQAVSASSELARPGIDRVRLAQDSLQEEFLWEQPKDRDLGKVLPLNKSTPLVIRENKIIDMKSDELLLRPPMLNSWLLKHQLPFQRKDIAQMDVDGDGFSNEEEFLARSNPNLAEDHPPVSDKLKLVERIEIPYVIQFSGESGDTFNIRPIQPRGRGSWVRVGDSFFNSGSSGKGRFQVLEFERKTVEDSSTGGQRNASELIVKDLKWGEVLTLVYGEEKNIPTYFARFSYNRGKAVSFEVDRGESFKIKGESLSPTYKLLEVSEQEAILSYTQEGGEEKKIAIPLQQTPNN